MNSIPSNAGRNRFPKKRTTASLFAFALLLLLLSFQNLPALNHSAGLSYQSMYSLSKAADLRGPDQHLLFLFCGTEITPGAVDVSLMAGADLKRFASSDDQSLNDSGFFVFNGGVPGKYYEQYKSTGRKYNLTIALPVDFRWRSFRARVACEAQFDFWSGHEYDRVLRYQQNAMLGTYLFNDSSVTDHDYFGHSLISGVSYSAGYSWTHWRAFLTGRDFEYLGVTLEAFFRFKSPFSNPFVLKENKTTEEVK